MGRSRNAILTAAGVLMSLPHGGSAQTTMRVTDDLCAACVIRVDTIARIDRTSPVSLSDQAEITALAGGEYLVIDAPTHPGLLLRYDSLGSVTAQIKLPPSIHPDRALVDASGRVVVIDWRTGLAVPIPASGGQGAEHQTVDRPRAALFLPEGRLILNAQSANPRRSRFALHTLYLGEPTVVSFDRDEARVSTPADTRRVRRELARSRDGSIWSGHIARYRLERWDPSVPALLDRLERDVDWFPPSAEVVPPSARVAPPFTQIRGIFEDEEGLLWVVLRVEATGWRPYELPPNTGMGHGPDGGYVGRNRHFHNQVFDTIVEVIDPSSASVVARRRFDAEFSGFIGENLLVEYASTSNDAGTYYILRPAIEWPE